LFADSILVDQGISAAMGAFFCLAKRNQKRLLRLRHPLRG